MPNKNKKNTITAKATFKEVLIKSGAHIAPPDFSSDCMKATQEYLMYFKELECNMTKICKQDVCQVVRRDLISASLMMTR